MKSLILKYPIEIEGKTITELAFRRAKARDMIVIGDYMPSLASIPDDANDPASAAKAMSGETFKAMTVIVGQLSDIGEATAGELDFVDLTDAVTEAMSGLGEAEGSNGEGQTGE